MPGTTAPTGLTKGIRFGQLFGIGFGTMIGVGWMAAAGGWIIQAGPGGAIVAFFVGALAVLVIGLSYAEMGGAFPFSGGEIVYAFEGLGTSAAFIVGWALTLIFVSVCAFEVVFAPWIVATLFPASSGPVLYRVLGADVTVGSLVLGFAGLIVLTGVNVVGSKLSVGLQNIATWLKVTATLGFVVAALAGGSEANRTPWFAADVASGSLLVPILGVLATVPVWYGGFNTLPQALGEVADLRNIRRLALVMTACILAGFTFFALVILATASAASRATLAGADFPVATALFSAFASPWPGRAVLAAGLLGLLTSWNASLFAGARVLFALGRARIIPAVFARVHPRYGSPAVAVIFIGVACAPMALLGRNSITPILNLIGLAYAVGYLFTAASLIRLRRVAPGLERPYVMPGHPWFTYLAAVLAATFLAVATFHIVRDSKTVVPAELAAFAIWAALGALVWFAGAAARRGISHDERRRLIRSG